MLRLDPRPGHRYLTISGAPVQVLEIGDDVMVLQGLASDNRFSVPANYPLEPLRGEAALEVRSNPYVARAARLQRVQSPKIAKQLAPIIDTLLLEGGKTTRGIIRELRRKASASCRGRDLAANVRARIYWLKKRGVLDDKFVTNRGGAETLLRPLRKTK